MKTKLSLALSAVLFAVLCFNSDVSAQKNFNLNGTWYASDTNNSLVLRIKKLQGYKIAFSFNIKNGAETGKLDGVGFFYKGTGGFTKPEMPDAGRLSKPCRIEFNQNDSNLIINHSPECKIYIKKDLVFAGVYSKTNNTPKKKNIFEKTSLPTPELENQLKNLTGNDYELFQAAMSEEQMLSEEYNQLAKRYNDCLKMNCLWDRAFMVHYDKELENAAVFFKNNEGKQFVYYYSFRPNIHINVMAHITNWTNDLRRKYGEITLVYRNKAINK